MIPSLCNCYRTSYKSTSHQQTLKLVRSKIILAFYVVNTESLWLLMQIYQQNPELLTAHCFCVLPEWEWPRFIEDPWVKLLSGDVFEVLRKQYTFLWCELSGYCCTAFRHLALQSAAGLHCHGPIHCQARRRVFGQMQVINNVYLHYSGGHLPSREFK